MSSVALIAHPSTPCELIRAFTVDAQRLQSGALHLIYRLEGAIDRLDVPAPRQPARANELWRHTCFEAFVREREAQAYAEFNFAPSGEWAAYDFDGYRSGMKPIEPIAVPSITCQRSRGHLQIDVQLELPQSCDSTNDLRAGLAAVIEDAQGKISYWAPAHPGARPDFHHFAGFALAIPAARIPGDY